MNPEQWQAVRELFLDASEREPEARAKLLEAAGASNPEVAREAALLLAADEDRVGIGGGVGATRIEDVPAALGLEVDAGELSAGEGPEHIGRYRVLGVLGDGRSGIVYRVKQENPEREVALKLLRSTMWSKGSLDRFRNEVRALSLLRHEHIARIYDAGTLPEPGGAARPYFVMELVEGKPITEFAASVEMDQRRVIELFLQVCDAVEYAHRQGVIHRDLKPGNVLVDSAHGADTTVEPAVHRAGTATVKVIDFGIARMLHAEERATLTGQVLGTPGYMSPEQAEGRSIAIDTRTDVFSAGAILRELLLPRKEAAKGRGEKKDRLSADLRLIVQTATEPDLERRYQSVSAFAGDLRRYLANRPIEARAPTVRYAASKFVRRNKALSAAIAIAGVAVIGMLVMQRRTQTQLFEFARVMLNEVAENLAGRIGGSADRKRILGDLLPRIEPFALAYPNDVGIQNDYAKLLSALGDTCEEEAQFPEAMKYLERALAVRERLAAMAPDDPRAVSKLSIAVVRVGDLSERARSAHSQKEFYLRALAIDEAAAVKWPANPNILSNLAFSYERLALTALNRDSFDEATEYSQKQSAAARKLIELEPESSTALWGMSSALGTKAAILEKRRLDAEMLEAGREEIRILRQLRQRSPDTKPAATRLVDCLAATAIKQALLDPSLLPLSAEMAKEAASLSRRLTVADQTDIAAALLHARVLCILSSVLANAGDSIGSDVAMAEAVATADALAARCNDCKEGVLARVAVQYSGVRTAVELKDAERVRATARAALPFARRVAETFPSVESKRIVLQLLCALPEVTAAEGAEAIELAQWLVRENPRDRTANMLALVESLTFAGRQMEADAVMDELKRSIPATETALLQNLELVRVPWKVKVRE